MDEKTINDLERLIRSRVERGEVTHSNRSTLELIAEVRRLRSPNDAHCDGRIFEEGERKKLERDFWVASKAVEAVEDQAKHFAAEANTARGRLSEVQAQAAAMRAALVKTRELINQAVNVPTETTHALLAAGHVIFDALSSDAGKDYVHRSEVEKAKRETDNLDGFIDEIVDDSLAREKRDRAAIDKARAEGAAAERERILAAFRPPGWSGRLADEITAYIRGLK